jgi:hypothetical protein
MRSPHGGYNHAVTFSIDRRHWRFALVLFALNIAGLMITASRRSVLFDGQTVLLMIACSALMSFLTAFLVVALFDTMSRRSKSR